MKKAQGLKILGDYRRAAKESLFSIYWPPENNNKSHYDAIKTALYHSRYIITGLRAKKPVDGWWSGTFLPGTEYEIRNYELFECIKLMEFTKKYHDVNSVYDLFIDWTKRPDVNIRVFTFAGLSYLEAVFDFVHALGCSIINHLQNAYLQYKKESNVSYFDQCKFLSKTPRVDDLKIDPEPDIIIKTWFDDIISGMHRAFPTSEYSRHKVEAEFNSIEKQLEYEWNLWKEQQEKCGQGNAENKEQPREKAVHGNRDKNGDKLLKQPITLKSFIEIHCDLTAKPDVQSKVSLLHEYNRKQKIKLPRLAKRYKPGQHKYYYVEDLKKNWADYQREMPTLPPP